MKTKTMNKIVLALLAAFILVMLVDSFQSALDEKIDSQNQMLCESALKSGNKKYQHKCKTYYETGDIKPLRSMDFNK